MKRHFLLLTLSHWNGGSPSNSVLDVTLCEAPNLLRGKGLGYERLLNCGDARRRERKRIAAGSAEDHLPIVGIEEDRPLYIAVCDEEVVPAG